MNVLVKLATSVAFFLLPHLAFTQNLIPNPGFEEVETCPDDLRQLNKARFWQEANAGTPELFHDCGFNTDTRPYEGEGMAGIILLCDYDNGVEYLQIKLADSLKENQRYCFSYYIKIDEKTPIAIDQVGAFFSKERLYSPNWSPFRKFPQVKTEKILGAETKTWQKVEGVFRAKGGEQFMTFGNFYARYYLHEKLVKHDGWDKGGWSSYYYLDNFELYEVESACGNKFNLGISSPEEEILWRHTVYFEVDKFSLSAEEEYKLEQFIQQLPPKFFQPIQIAGHTDSDAGLSYNLHLSQSRAETVLAFLNANDLRNTYLSFFGEEKPMNENLTERQKALNRRVEIIIDRP